MSSNARTYFSSLSALVSDICRRQWQTEIEHAEAGRLVDPTVMDILAAHPVSPIEHGASHDAAKASSKVEQWIQTAIEIEENQFILSLLFISIADTKGKV